MATIPGKTVVGVFDNHTAAQQALTALRQAGFSESQLGVVAPGVELKASRSGATDADDERGAVRGAAIGAATGATAGAAAGVLTMVSGLIPVIGPVVAGGALAVLLGSIAAGAATGGLVGALMGMDITEDEARHYEEQVQGGRVLVTVRAGDRAEEAAAILRSHGGTTAPQLAAAR
jgi:hypothetical protein